MSFSPPEVYLYVLDIKDRFTQLLKYEDWSERNALIFFFLPQPIIKIERWSFTCFKSCFSHIFIQIFKNWSINFWQILIMQFRVAGLAVQYWCKDLNIFIIMQQIQDLKHVNVYLFIFITGWDEKCGLFFSDFICQVTWWYKLYLLLRQLTVNPLSLERMTAKLMKHSIPSSPPPPYTRTHAYIGKWGYNLNPR